MGVSRIEQDGLLFALGVTGISIDQQCRTDFCAPKYTRDSLNLTNFVWCGERIFVQYFAGSEQGGEVLYIVESCLIKVGFAVSFVFR